MKDFLPRFLAKIQKAGPNECWEWTAARFHYGHGAFKLHGKQVKASRVMWMIFHGHVPRDKDVLHKCNNPPCVNPSHLYLGTDVDNAKDRKVAGTQPSYVGELNNSAQLTEKDVIDIRNRYIPKVVTLGMLAKEYRVTFQQISNIIRRKCWCHI